MVNKKIVVVATVIALIVAGFMFFLGIKSLNNNEKYESKETNTTHVATINAIEQNKINNSTIDNKIEENIVAENIDEENEAEENKVEENKVKENVTSNNATTENKESEKSTSKNSSSKSKITEKDPEKLAISLAKEKWGNINSNVYFDVEDKNESKGIYMVVVRDNSTTVEMVTYKVDINKKTVTE